MINLSQPLTSLSQVHRVAADPGRDWIRDEHFLVDAPPDDVGEPAPEDVWAGDAVRTGVCGAVAPRVVVLADGGFRMYYTQMLPREGFPAGALDYDNCRTRILSSFSPDGIACSPEPGVRLAPEQCGDGIRRVVSADVVPVAVGEPKLRMYFECCPGPQTEPSAIHSAVSDDGLNWTVEPGERLGDGEHNFMSSRLVHLDDGRCRLYCCQRGLGIISAISTDGLVFEREPGVRIASDTEHDALVAFASEILTLDDGTFAMYYAGYSSPTRCQILRGTSADGMTWEKETEPVLSPGGTWDAVKSSEMCIYPLPNDDNRPSRYAMAYEACDGKGKDNRGVWRIAGAKTPR